LLFRTKKLADILRPGPVVAFGLDVNLPLSAETVEIIDEQAAHERLDRFVNIADPERLA